MAHTCHATGCTTRTAPEMWGCRAHWFMVPKPIRDRIWKTYRVGQCDDKNPSKEYCQAAKDAVIAVARKEGLTPDTRLYDLYLSQHDLTVKEGSTPGTRLNILLHGDKTDE
jgi:hypothetical protein